MPNIIQAWTTITPTQPTWYLVVLNQSVQFYNGSTWVNSFASAALATFSNGFYTALFPSVAAGFYDILFYEQAGVSPASTDTVRGSLSENFDGSNLGNLMTPDDIANAVLDQPSGIEVSWTLRQIMRIIAAATAGSTTSIGNTVYIKGITGSPTRITGTVDSVGNRTLTNTYPN